MPTAMALSRSGAAAVRMLLSELEPRLVLREMGDPRERGPSRVCYRSRIGSSRRDVQLAAQGGPHRCRAAVDRDLMRR
jgi:hypothetical protein